MIKTLLFLFTLFFFSLTFTTNAQSMLSKSGSKTVVYKQNVNLPLSSIEKEKLTEVYGESLKENVLNNPQRVKSIKNILRNRIEILKMSDYRKNYLLLSQVPLFDKYNASLKRGKFRVSTFNPFMYNFNFYAKQVQVFRVDDTDYYILIKSQHQN